jgi:hypothetical protein
VWLPKCRYCGSKQNLTIDHVVPLSKGGKWVWENLVAACTKCNGKKGSKSLKQLGWKLKSRPRARTSNSHSLLSFPLPYMHGIRCLTITDAHRGTPCEQEPSPYQLGLLLGIEAELTQPPKVRQFTSHCSIHIFYSNEMRVNCILNTSLCSSSTLDLGFPARGACKGSL